jgi:4-alpha-methyl-delta7-sterol-4alpha-methyl oxidase
MEALWRHLITGSSNFTLYALLPTLVVNVAWIVGGLLCLALDFIPSLRKYKIQARDNGTTEFWRCARHSLRNKLISEIPLTFAAYPFFVWLGIRKDLPLPSVATVLATLLACLVIEDAWHYFAHRTLHLRWPMKHIHSLHHHYMTPFGLASSYAHPLETLFTGFGTVLPMLILRPHLFTLLLWVVVKQAQATAVHCGYMFPFRPSRFLPFVVSAGFHDRHHRRFNRNFAPNFVWMDYLFGTADTKNLGPHPGAPA